MERVFGGQIFGENLPRSFPVLIRKTGSSLWTEPRNTSQEIAEKFFIETKRFSYWEIREPAEIALVAHLLDAGVDEPLSRSTFFVTLPVDDARNVADFFEQLDENCQCTHLQGRHYNIAVEPEKGQPSIDAIRTAGLIKLSVAQLKAVQRALTAAGCRAASTSNGCVCEL